MNIQIAVADNYLLDPTIDLVRLRDIGALWGSWRTWRAYATDNVVCYDAAKAEELVNNRFGTACNLYIPESVHLRLKPVGVRAFGSLFAHPVDHADQIVAAFLAASTADIVLLLGYDLSRDDTHDAGYLHQAAVAYPEVQFVGVGETQTLAPKFAGLDNLTQDTVANVLEMFV